MKQVIFGNTINPKYMIKAQVSNPSKGWKPYQYPQKRPQVYASKNSSIRPNYGGQGTNYLT